MKPNTQKTKAAESRQSETESLEPTGAQTPEAPVHQQEPIPAPDSATAQPPPEEPAQSPPGQNPELLAKEYWERLLRATADFENFKKRAARERQEAVKYANESLLEKLVPVLDNFDMALAAADTGPDGSGQAFRQGVEMIRQQLKGALGQMGLAEIDALNQPFDPSWHEAVAQMETTAIPEGHVLQQMRKGYKLRDRLIRPAMVVVAKAPADQPAES